MPPVSEAQRKAMWSAAEGRSTLGIPRSVGKEFVAKDGAPIAAGIVLVAPDGDILLLRRASTEQNYGGHWGLPGGKAEDGETAIEAAIRETKEEIGLDIDAEAHGLKVIDKTMTPNGMVFTTFVKPVTAKFFPKFDDEHSGFAWASLDMLPQPLHPSVARTLGEHIGVAQDMKPADWDGLVKGFLKWVMEEEKEPEHAADSLAMDECLYDARGKRILQHDILAMDFSPSVRSYDKDGQLHIERTPISKAMICEYFGREIPHYKALGLEPDRKYRLLRDPEELKKGAASSNGKQLMFIHVAVNADNPQQDEWVGAVGTDAEYDDPYLYNSLTVHVRKGIEGIENDTQRQISSSYRYRADMTPGTFKGESFEGTMRDIDFNHVCLVENGRCGDDVLVHDSKPKELPMKLSRRASVLKSGTMAFVQPLLAMDGKGAPVKVDLTPIFAGVTADNSKSRRSQIVSGIEACLKGKLAADAKLDGLKDFLGALDGDMPKEAEDENDEDEDDKKDKKAEDEDPKEKFLKEKLSAEDKAAYDAMCGAKDEADETEEEKKAREAKEAKDKKAKDAKAAADKAARDAAPEKKPDMVEKPAMDAAIAKATAKATADALKIGREIREAEKAVQPYVGALDMAFDSAQEVYAHALKAMDVEVEGVHPSAYAAMLKMCPVPGAKNASRHLAMDAAPSDSFTKMYPDAGRIGHA